MTADISPELEFYAKRAGIEYHPEHYRFARTQALYTPPLQKSRPVESWLRIVVCALFGVSAIATGILVLSAVSDFLNHGSAAL